MHQRRPDERSDITGQTTGDVSGDPFPDWDNPEDLDEDAPEGYYDPPEADRREDEDDDSYVPAPDDPDYDLSEEAGYAGWEDPGRSEILPQWAIALFCIVVICAIVLGVLLSVS
jgi:hypothetical protein